MPDRCRGRWAPSPTGLLHLGNARTALVAWLSVRSRGGTLLWRIEDVDTVRAVPALVESGLEDLAWLGLDWDEGPRTGSVAEPGSPPGVCTVSREDDVAPFLQSECFGLYADAVRALDRAGRVYPCTYTRSEMRRFSRKEANAALGRDSREPRPTDWLESILEGEDSTADLRFLGDRGQVCFEDRLHGRCAEELDPVSADLVLRRRDGLWTYSLAVIVDDVRQKVTEVVRGADLLDATAAQIGLLRALGGEVPEYGHVPLVLGTDGAKLAKRDGDVSLAELRSRGVTPERIVGWMAFTLGLRTTPAPVAASELVGDFLWERIDCEPTVVDEQFRRSGLTD